MKKTAKMMLCLILALVLVLSFAACGSSDSEGEGGDDSQALAKEDLGTIHVGIDGAYPPFCFLNDDDEVDGFEVAVMKEIAERNDLDIQCDVTAWDGMFGALDSGRIDTVAESITITDEKKETYNFSCSYRDDNNRFLVRAGEEGSIASYEDLAGKKIGVAAGQTAYNQLLDIQKEHGVEFEIVPYDSSTNAYDVSLGRIDATYMDPIAGMQLAKEGGFDLAVAELPAYSADLCGYPFVKDSERADLIRQIFNDTLKEMDSDGTLKALSEEWLGADVINVQEQ